MFRKTAPAVIVVLAFSASTFGQQWAEKMFSATSHDFGVVARGEKAEYAFVLENLYVEDVHIAGVRASCSCTKPEIQVPTLKKITKQLVVRGRQPFQVSEVICDGRGFTAVDTNGESKSNVHLISVTYEAGQEADKAVGNIFVRTTVGTSPHVRIYAMSGHPGVATGPAQVR